MRCFVIFLSVLTSWCTSVGLPENNAGLTRNILTRATASIAIPTRAYDAHVSHWPQAVRAVAERFPDAEIIVPSHGPAGGRSLFDDTIALVNAHAKS